MGISNATDLNITLNNVVNMTYDTAIGSVTQADNTTITIQQPMLTLSKSSDPVNGSSIAAGNVSAAFGDVPS
ncbi:MAG: hypothetical protein ABFS02_13600 [Pseudomonadota bacterium]